MQRWSPWPQGRFRGHNLKSFALNPASPRKCPVLGLRTALFYDTLKMGQGHEQCCFVSEHARELAKKKFLTIEFCGKVAKLWAKTFFLRSPAFCKNF